MATKKATPAKTSTDVAVRKTTSIANIRTPCALRLKPTLRASSRAAAESIRISQDKSFTP